MNNETLQQGIAETPWWLERGPEICEFCRVEYHYEARLHCVECDGPVCPLCAVSVIETRVISCPECHSTPAGES